MAERQDAEVRPCQEATKVGPHTVPAASEPPFDQPFIGMTATYGDFLRYVVPDMRTNTTRGLLAEMMVARSCGATKRNPEWMAFDVLHPDGITRIEVKSSGYLQSWIQDRPSKIEFTALATRAWDPVTGEAPERTYNADIYVFCVQTAKDHETYNPMDTRQWDFYVVAGPKIAATGYRSMGLNTVKMLAGTPVAYPELSEAIEAVRGALERHRLH